MDYFAAMRAFVSAVELGSFSKAAAKEGVKISTVSRYVSGLEADLGAALFNRSTRRIHITEVGTCFHERAVRVLAELEEARFAASSLNARPQGLLRVTIPGAFGRRHVMPHIGEFLAEYPDIRIDAELTELPLDLIESGTDVAIRIGTLGDSTLVASRLAPHRRVLVASPAYLLTAPPLNDLQDIARHQCLLYSQQPAGAWYFRRDDDPLSEPVEVPVRGSIHTNDPESLLQAAVDGLGLALLPTWLANEDIRAGRLLPLMAHWQGSISAAAESGIWGIYPPKKVVSPKVRAFLNFFGQRFGKRPYWELDSVSPES